MVRCTPAGFLTLAGTIMMSSKSSTNSRNFTIRQYIGHFGCSPDVCTTLWELIPYQKGGLPKHLLWALLFLKTYNAEDVLSTMVGTTRKTFRKWMWIYVIKIHKLKKKVVSFSFPEFLVWFLHVLHWYTNNI